MHKTQLREQIMQCLSEADRAIPCKEIGKRIKYSAAPANLNHALKHLAESEMVERLGRGKFHYLITDKGRSEFGLTNPRNKTTQHDQLSRTQRFPNH